MKELVKQVDVGKAIDFSDLEEPNDLDDYVDKFHSVSKYISSFSKENDFKQKDIAKRLDMAESQISKWLNGFHNLTLKSIIKLESVSDIQLLNPAIWAKRNSIKSAINNQVEYTLTAYNFSRPTLTTTLNSETSNEDTINTVVANPAITLESMVA